VDHLNNQQPHRDPRGYVMAQVTCFIPVEDIYPRLEPTVECLKSLLRGLSRTDALLWCARLNLIVSSPFLTEAKGQAYAINCFLPFRDERDKLWRLLGQRGGIKRTAVFFRGQLLELARWIAIFCKDLPGDGQTFGDPTVRRVFGQAALVAAGLWGQRVYDATLADVSSLPPEEARRRSMATFRASFIENSRGSVAPVIIGRGYQIWTAVLKKTPELDDEFVAATGMHILEYLRLMATLCMQWSIVDPVLARQSNAHAGLFDARFRATEPNLRRGLCSLLAHEGILVDDLCALLSKEGSVGGRHIPTIRNHPVVRTLDGRAIILDPVFLAEHACVGPLFLLARSRGKSKVNILFQSFGDAFESYVGGLVQDRYPNGVGLVRRSFLNVTLTRDGQQVGQIDAAILLDQDALCIIEAKAVFIRDDTLDDNHAYIEAVGKKYGASPDGRGERLQGVGQLARAAASLAAGDLGPELPDEIRSALVLYPVLLVHDRNLDAPGTAEYLAQEFQRQLAPDQRIGGCVQKGRLRVALPIVLTVDDFEWLQASLENFSLVDFLREFSSSAPTRNASIRDFAFQSRFNTNLRNPQAQWDVAMKMLLSSDSGS